MLKKLIGIAVVFVTIVLIVIMVKSKKRPSFDQEQKSPELKLIMENISPIKEGVIITANGNVMAKWQTEIKSEVIGPITYIGDNLLVGASFNKGDSLLTIESINYESELSRQLANLARSQELLFEEEVKSERAINDWKSVNSNKPANDFTIRVPQLNSAKMSLKAAELDLKVARNNLSKTTIKAPYDGFVISKFVDLGETIQVGTKIADVFSSEDLELILPLNNTQIEMILSSKDKEIKIYDITNPEKFWMAQFSRVDQMIDQKSRWRNLYLTIAQ
jgi:multidrug resistance efflux pump